MFTRGNNTYARNWGVGHLLKGCVFLGAYSITQLLMLQVKKGEMKNFTLYWLQLTRTSLYCRAIHACAIPYSPETLRLENLPTLQLQFYNIIHTPHYHEQVSIFMQVLIGVCSRSPHTSGAISLIYVW